ncbi:BT_3987 domain-containing protein [Sinomicrobium soli]|uniref:BT_3987 domain-containing protein n=1 Tax=Sinomicrobium sp. N-1-3-6 TaxID=2219864 RepID=UPI000DCD4D5F|nr:DUF1735 domain-containing protein [Sinomicrobium sp. N-1-3-6]RAV30264.1 hypothetical protein DN748_05620 [Sinomicrobium sp. N-1-3-6]
MKTRVLLIVGVLGICLSCEKYDEYIEDYEFSAVYFATQKPLRTIVAYDEMKFNVGVALGGKRSNAADEYADFVTDPTLLEDETLLEGNDFILMPEAYYSLSDESRMQVPKGEFIGDITVTLNREAFTSDELSRENTYAIPLRITGTSTDSILGGRDYTILVVRYISRYDGTYYHKGIQTETDQDGNVVEDTIYSTRDLIDHETWNVSTLGAATISTPGAGAFADGSLVLDVDESSNVVTIAPGSENLEITEQSGTYDSEKREFYLDYGFTRDSRTYRVSDTLVLRQPPEKDLYFEEW